MNIVEAAFDAWCEENEDDVRQMSFSKLSDFSVLKNQLRVAFRAGVELVEAADREIRKNDGGA